MSNKIHTTQWRRTHEKILEAMHKGARTLHEIYLETGISYRSIASHRREIRK